MRRVLLTRRQAIALAVATFAAASAPSVMRPTDAWAAGGRVTLTCVPSGPNPTRWCVSPKSFVWADFSAIDPADERLWDGSGVPVRFAFSHGHVDATLKAERSADAVLEMALKSPADYGSFPTAYDIRGKVKYPFMYSTSSYPNDFAHVTMTFTGMTMTADAGYDTDGWQMAFGDPEIMTSGISGADPLDFERTTITADTSIRVLGYVGTTASAADPNQSYQVQKEITDKRIVIGGGSSKTGASASAGAIVAAADQPGTFSVRFEHVYAGGWSSIAIGFNLPNLSSVLLSAKAVDDQGGLLATYEVGTRLQLGGSWDFSAHAMDGDVRGYDYVGLAQSSAPISGTLSESTWGPKEVTLVFRKHAYTRSCVATDPDGNVIRTLDAGSVLRIGESWAYEAPDIGGWRLIGLADGSDLTSGRMDASNLGDKRVTFVYARDATALPETGGVAPPESVAGAAVTVVSALGLTHAIRGGGPRRG